MDDAAIRREATELTADLIRIDTGNPPGNEAPAAHLLRAYLEAAGIERERTAAIAAGPILIARLPARGGARSLPLGGPAGVVPADGAGWRHPPFAGHVD